MFRSEPSTESNQSLNMLYNEVQEASYYRLFKGFGCIIHSTELASIKTSGFLYPEAKIKQLLDSIMLGKTEDCKIIYNDIINNRAL